MSCRVTVPRVSPRAASLMALGSSIALAFSSPLSADLLENGSFAAGLEGWSTTGDVSRARGGWDGDGSVVLRPGPGATATLSQVVTGLEPRARYTVAARIRTTDRLSPPILGIRNGAQIAKAHGWVATGDEGRWLEPVSYTHLTLPTTPYV